jgi:chemotaxis protein CheD
MVVSVDSSKVMPPLKGFEAISRTWDEAFNCPVAKLKPGEYYITLVDELITTLLGSCIAVCIRDVDRGIGSMNHFMLPISADGYWSGRGDLSSLATRYGNFAMEHMINDVLSQGGRKTRLEVKVFGGGQMTAEMTGIGLSNIKFVYHYLDTEGMRIAREDVGGDHPRRIIYFPRTGRVLMKRLSSMHNKTVIEREKAYHETIISQPLTGEMELF